ncbi:MAG: hypothetical protein A4E74_02541 [Syntrophus sp. PtaB.Bin075]|nr:MAG: hypothetical protein A4E74_02541 [Syntrophus sp. PtaB.Bin075]
MTQNVVTGLFTLLGVILGILGTLLTQLFLRKEKFKEVLYKECLVAYKEAAEGCRKLLMKTGTIIDIARNAQGAPPDESHLVAELTEFASLVDQLRNCLWRHGAVMSDDVLQKAHCFIFKAVDVRDIVAHRMESPFETEFRTDLIKEDVLLGCKTSLDAMRKELCVDELSKDTMKTAYFGKNLIRKLSDKGKDYTGDYASQGD